MLLLRNALILTSVLLLAAHDDIPDEVGEDAPLVHFRAGHFKHNLYLDEVDGVVLVHLLAGAAWK